jgi:hypothetical protein
VYSNIRHVPIFDAEKHERPVLIAGCGAVGGYIAMQLLCLGVKNLTVFDPDIVELHNLPNQIFEYEDLGIPKVVGLAEAYQRKFNKSPTEGEFDLFSGRLPEDMWKARTVLMAQSMGVKPFLILAVDTMKARLEIAQHLKDSGEAWHVIETRMASSYGNVYSFDLQPRFEKWKDTLISDEGGEVSACGGAITVVPTVQAIASLAVWEYIKICVDEFASREQTDIYLKPALLSARSM